jgi:hypothetical protein
MLISILQHPFRCVVIIIFCEFIMPLDINKFWKYVDDYPWTKEQKIKFLQSVWSSLESPADIAFWRHPVQQCRDKASEKDLQSPDMDVKSDSKHLPN